MITLSLDIGGTRMKLALLMSRESVIMLNHLKERYV